MHACKVSLLYTKAGDERWSLLTVDSEPQIWGKHTTCSRCTECVGVASWKLYIVLFMELLLCGGRGGTGILEACS